MDLCLVFAYDAQEVKTVPTPGITSWNIGTREENFRTIFLRNWKAQSIEIRHVASTSRPLPSLYI